jgi:putative transposase
MRRYIRKPAPGATCFFTLALQDRSARYLVDHVAALRASVADAKARHPFRIDAMVVLPEHIHALWTFPEQDGDFATRLMLVKQGFTRRLHAAGVLSTNAATARGVRGERSLWQRRFWEYRVRNEEDFAQHVDYIHFNPVKHGWVLRAREWPYSSFHRFVQAGKLESDWGISVAIEGRFGE